MTITVAAELVASTTQVLAVVRLHERGHTDTTTDSIVKVTSNNAAATREHLVRRPYMSGERLDTICMHDTCTLIPAHVRDACS